MCTLKIVPRAVPRIVPRILPRTLPSILTRMVIHLGCSQVKLLLKLAVKLVAVMWVTMLWGQTQQDLQCHAAGFLGST